MASSELVSEKKEGNNWFVKSPIFKDFRIRMMIIAVGFLAALLPWFSYNPSYYVIIYEITLLDLMRTSDQILELFALCYFIGLILCSSRGFTMIYLGIILSLISIIVLAAKVSSAGFYYDLPVPLQGSSIGFGLVVGFIITFMLIPFAYRQSYEDRVVSE